MKQRTPCRTKGIALVIVLAFLVLISGIVIAFFSSVSTELVSAKATSDSAATHQLADSAVNVVMAQIVDGTKSQETSNVFQYMVPKQADLWRRRRISTVNCVRSWLV